MRIISEEVRNRVKPGFTRVFIPARNKTIQIRTKHAQNKEYMLRNGLVLMPEAIHPAMAFASPAPIEVKAVMPTDTAPKKAAPKKKASTAKVTPSSPAPKSTVTIQPQS